MFRVRSENSNETCSVVGPAVIRSYRRTPDYKSLWGNGRWDYNSLDNSENSSLTIYDAVPFQFRWLAHVWAQSEEAPDGTQRQKDLHLYAPGKKSDDSHP